MFNLRNDTKCCSFEKFLGWGSRGFVRCRITITLFRLVSDRWKLIVRIVTGTLDSKPTAFRVSRSEVESSVLIGCSLYSISADAIDVRFDALSCNRRGNKWNCDPYEYQSRDEADRAVFLPFFKVFISCFYSYVSITHVTIFFLYAPRITHTRYFNILIFLLNTFSLFSYVNYSFCIYIQRWYMRAHIGTFFFKSPAISYRFVMSVFACVCIPPKIFFILSQERFWALNYFLRKKQRL